MYPTNEANVVENDHGNNYYRYDDDDDDLIVHRFT